MINENNCTTEACTVHPYPYKRICWSAIFVGAFVGVGLSFLLNLFGIAIGLSTFTLNSDGATVVAVGGLIGIIIGIIASMLVAGYTAGYLGRQYCPKRNLGIVYGFTTWTVSLVFMSIFAMHAGDYVNNYTNSISSSVAVVSDTEKTDTKARMEPASPATTDASKAPGQTQQEMKVTVTPASMAWGAFIVFVLFFLGALSACIGACWAMTCCRED